ncbi:MAG: MBG domain-containing protein, partial [Sulfuritalea sp.]|nr:MBG domain-containing protein [Sulfuritalea sp.]
AQNVSGFTASGLVNGETTAVLSGVTAGGSGTNAGSYASVASGTDGNYTLSFVDGALTIAKADLTVIANNASKLYDGLVWSGGNGVNYSGFVNGEIFAVLGGSLGYGGASQGAVNVGSYILTPSGLTAGNYAVSFVSGTLTIASTVPTVPGAPPNSYAGAIVSASGGAVANAGGSMATGNLSAPGNTVLASADGSAPGIPGLPGFSIQPCGQNLPPALSNDCR